MKLVRGRPKKNGYLTAVRVAAEIRPRRPDDNVSEAIVVYVGGGGGVAELGTGFRRSGLQG